MSTGVLCSIAVLCGLVLLAVLPRWLRPTQFTFPVSTSKSETSLFPIGQPLPAITGLPQNPRLPLAQLIPANGSLIVNFWATWCAPCVEELPSLEMLNRRLALSSARVPKLVLISVDEDPKQVTALFRTLDFKPTFLVLHDPKAELSQSVGTVKYPETYWVNSQSKILHKWIGPQDWLSNDVIHRLAQPF